MNKNNYNQKNDAPQKWIVTKSETLVERPWLNVRKDTVRLPDGKVCDEYYVLHYPTWVNVIAITEDGQFILERQYRHAIAEVSIEICAGCAEEGESPLEAAKRELLEETGYAGGQWTELLVTAPNASTMDNYCYSFLAEGVKKVDCQHLDETEDIQVFLASREEVLQMLRGGDFKQAMMIAPLWKYFATVRSLDETSNYSEDDRRFMEMAIQLSVDNVDAGGGPFGAVIVKNGEVVATGVNRVVPNNDPTAHAEVMAVRAACHKTGIFKLEGCTIYSSCEPCPMCLSALYWAGIDRICYANTKDDAKAIDFDDSFIYEQLDLDSRYRSIRCDHFMRDKALRAFCKWKDKEDKVRY